MTETPLDICSIFVWLLWQMRLKLMLSLPVTVIWGEKKKKQQQKTCFKENICYASQYPEKLVKPREEEKRTHT